MFGSIKKAMAVAAVVVAGWMVAPAMGSAAPVWNTSAASTSGAEAAHGAGQLTAAVVVGGVQRSTTCDVTFTAGLWNGTDGGTARGLGHITAFLLGASAGGACTTSIPACSVVATANTTTPWSIAAVSGPSAVLGGVNLVTTYSGGAGCPLNGASLNATGSITGSVTPAVITFANAGGLSTPLGPATVNGEVELLWEDDDSAVELS